GERTRLACRFRRPRRNLLWSKSQRSIKRPRSRGRDRQHAGARALPRKSAALSLGESSSVALLTIIARLNVPVFFQGLADLLLREVSLFRPILGHTFRFSVLGDK